jgi:hypothetical protein
MTQQPWETRASATHTAVGGSPRSSALAGLASWLAGRLTAGPSLNPVEPASSRGATPHRDSGMTRFRFRPASSERHRLRPRAPASPPPKVTAVAPVNLVPGDRGAALGRAAGRSNRRDSRRRHIGIEARPGPGSDRPPSPRHRDAGRVRRRHRSDGRGHDHRHSRRCGPAEGHRQWLR